MIKVQHLKRIFKNNYACILIILTAGGLLLSQTITGHPIVGADSVFHYNRFYETYSQLRKHNFSWFQSIYGFNQSGRIVNAVYGPLFAYCNGLLLFVVHSWYQYQLFASLIIYLIAGYGSPPVWDSAIYCRPDSQYLLNNWLDFPLANGE